MRNSILLRTALATLTLTALTGCGSDDNDPGPGGVSVGEARALDEAAAMIEDKSRPPEVPQAAAPAGK